MLSGSLIRNDALIVNDAQFIVCVVDSIDEGTAVTLTAHVNETGKLRTKDISLNSMWDVPLWQPQRAS